MKKTFILTILILLSALSCKPQADKLEKINKQSFEKNSNLHQFYKGYETPNYRVLEKIDAIEIRQYQPRLVAEVEVDGNEKEAAKKGFGILARYIFGKNTAKQKSVATPATSGQTLENEKPRSQKIEMTSPVIQERLEENRWLVQFTMPRKFDLEALPAPQDSSIRFRTIPAKKMVAITFDGRWIEENFQKNTAKLEQFIAERNRQFESKTHIKLLGKPVFAYYDDPLTFPWNRRNEVLLEMK